MAILASFFLVVSISLGGCSSEVSDPELVKNTYLELVDWHISGLWVINCPVAWIRVTNYNTRPITEIVVKYQTYSIDGRALNEGTCLLEGYTVKPGQTKNIPEQYLGLVDLESEKLTVSLYSVNPG